MTHKRQDSRAAPSCSSFCRKWPNSHCPKPPSCSSYASTTAETATVFRSLSKLTCAQLLWPLDAGDARSYRTVSSYRGLEAGGTRRPGDQAVQSRRREAEKARAYPEFRSRVRSLPSRTSLPRGAPPQATLSLLKFWCPGDCYENLLPGSRLLARIPGNARFQRARGIASARKMRAVPGILANELRNSSKLSFALESRRIMETWWLFRSRRIHHQDTRTRRCVYNQV